jgi:serine/threonine protein kinase
MKEPRLAVCPFCRKEHGVDVDRCPATGESIPAVYRMHGTVLIDKYEVIRPIGEGGMGIVYEGQHRSIGRKVAIKFLFPYIKADAEVIARFQNEAKVAASIAHKNIRDILDMDATPDGTPFIVMEYLEGMSLGKIVKMKGRIPPPTAVKIALQILSALHGVHSKSIVHRDLKPENIFITQQAGGEEIVKIVDFGISHLCRPIEGEALVTTKDDAIVGTPKYLSPEQAASEKVDERADLYAVGTLLYEMVTGRHPFVETNYNKIIVAILTRDPEPPGKFVQGLAPELEGVILKALKKEPYNRFQSAAEFTRELRRLMAEGTVEDIPPVAAPDGAGLQEPTASPQATGHVPLATSAPPSALSPSVGRRRLWRQAAAAVLVLLIIALSAAVYRAVQVSKPGPGTGARAPSIDGTTTASDAAEDAAATWRVTLPGLPEGAAVYVDGVMHPESPLLLEPAEAPRRVRIEADGYEPWEETVAVHADVTLEVEMKPLKVRDATGKPSGKVKDVPTGHKSKLQIDVDYPGTGMNP